MDQISLAADTNLINMFFLPRLLNIVKFVINSLSVISPLSSLLHIKTIHNGNKNREYDENQQLQNKKIEQLQYLLVECLKEMKKIDLAE